MGGWHPTYDTGAGRGGDGDGEGDFLDASSREKYGAVLKVRPSV